MSPSPTSVDQCLFGYDDGHRLLASSVSLGDEAVTLTELSDLAPGTVFGGSDGYWTGIPAPAIGRYALMRTWSAPEMPRPGCVWTQALLVDPSALGDLPNLLALTSLVSRPAGPADRGRYREPLQFSRIADVQQGVSSHLDLGLIASLLESLYGKADPVVGVPTPGSIDREIFSAWSQQWPRLRRNFRFQTAVSREPRTQSATRLDMAFRLGAASRPAAGGLSGTDWLSAAATDAAGGDAGTLRKFLWRYGADVKRQRASFRPLVEIRLLGDGLAEGAGSKLLDIVTEAFPDPGDASRLKQDIVDGTLAPGSQLEILWFVLSKGGGAVLPTPTEAGIARLAKLWPQRPDDLLHLAESTAEAEDELGRSIFQTVTGAVPLDEFWTLTVSYPRVRRRMVEARPGLLLSADLATLDNGTIASLIELIPAGVPSGADLVGRLLPRDDAALAALVTERFPREVASQVVAAADGRTVTVGRAWVRGLVRNPQLLLDPAVMGRITRTSLIYELAEALGWLTPDVAAAGTEPWIAALVDVSNDLDDDRRDTLRSFLVALAILTGGDGGRRVLEKFFEAVHDQILRSRLPWRAKDILSPLLPELGWGRGWDLGLRLRMAVSTAYVEHDYPAACFASLATGKKTRSLLAEAARDVPGGKPLAKAIGG